MLFENLSKEASRANEFMSVSGMAIEKHFMITTQVINFVARKKEREREIKCREIVKKTLFGITFFLVVGRS